MVIVAAPALGEMRTWTDKSGGFSVQAEFVELTGDQVTLKREDGNNTRIPLEKLSATDQEVARALAQGRNNSNAEQNPFAPTSEKPSKPGNSETILDDTNSRMVLVEGVGTTAEEAIKGAFHNAVRQVVGEMVDAETLVKNDALVKDQVLMYSDAFIPKHRMVSEKQEGGLFHVTIQATVQRQNLVARLKTVNITVKALDGQSMFGELVTKMDAADNALAMREKVLDGYPASVVRASVLGRPWQDAHADGRATMSYDLRLDVDPEKYDTVETKLVALLEKNATKKDELFVVSRMESDVEKYLRKEWEENWTRELLDREPTFASGSSHSKKVPFQFGEIFTLRPAGMEVDKGFGYEWLRDEPDPQKILAIVVNTARNRASDRTTWRWFQVERPAKLRYGVRVDVSFLDSDGKEILHDRVHLGRESPGGSLPWRTEQGRGADTELILSPYLVFCYGTDWMYTPTVTLERSVQVTAEDVRSLQSVRCVVTPSDDISRAAH
jgi:hypothetical protein